MSRIELRVGWIGTGRMGYALARRLSQAGVDVAVWNRTRAKAEPLTQFGTTVVDDPSDLADRDVVFTMVSTSDDLDQVLDRLHQRARQIRMGDPMLPDTQMGPAATRAQLDKDISMVERAVAEGAQLLCGGRRARVPGLEDGFFFEPTILHEMRADNFIMTEEVFGPVLGIARFRDDDEVLQLANASRFGLAAGVWTRDLRRAHSMARRLQAGTVWINTYRAMAVNSPFGGYKSSGLGRVNGIEAIDQFLQTKSVWCELSEDIQDPFVLKV